MSSTRFVCPFCPLHCDDVAFRTKQSGTEGAATAWEFLGGEYASNECTVLGRQGPAAWTHSRRSEPVPDELLHQARAWVGEASSIAVLGRVVDFATARAVRRFLDQTGARWCFAASPGDGYAESFARVGGFSATLGDAVAGHQTIILIGGPEQHWPRIEQRLRRAADLFRWRDATEVGERLARLRHWLRHTTAVQGQTSLGLATAREVDPDLVGTFQRLQAAEGVVLLIDPSVAGKHAAASRPFWSTVQGLLEDLNSRIRASLLRFDESITLRSVLAWSADPAASPPGAASVEGNEGEWTASGLAADAIDAAVASDRALDAGWSADLVVLLRPWPGTGAEYPGMEFEESGDGAGLRGQMDRRRSIVIGHPAVSVAGDPAKKAGWQVESVIQLSAATPGISQAGTVIRGDGSVALPLRGEAETGLRTPAEWLDRLAEKKK